VPEGVKAQDDGIDILLQSDADDLLRSVVGPEEDHLHPGIPEALGENMERAGVVVQTELREQDLRRLPLGC
jgi:hypothetical protein